MFWRIESEFIAVGPQCAGAKPKIYFMDQKLLEAFIGVPFSDGVNDLQRRMGAAGWLKGTNAVVGDFYAIQFSEKGIDKMSKFAPLVQDALNCSTGKPPTDIFKEFAGVTLQLFAVDPNFFSPPLNLGELAAFLAMSNYIALHPPPGFDLPPASPPPRN